MCMVLDTGDTVEHKTGKVSFLTAFILEWYRQTER